MKTGRIPSRQSFVFPGRRLLAVFAATVLLSACSLPVPHEPEQTSYRLNPLHVAIPAQAENVPSRLGAPVLIRLERVSAANGFDSEAMIYSRDRQTLSRYRDNRWIATPSVLIGDALDQTLQEQSWVAGVLRAGQRLPAKLEVSCSLDRLEHDIEATGGQVHLTMGCLLVSGSGRNVLAHWRFDHEKTIRVNDAEHYAEAAQSLLDQALKDLVGQIYRTAFSSPRRG